MCVCFPHPLTPLSLGFSESKDRHVQLEKDIRNLHGRTNIPRHSRIRSLLPLCRKSQDPNGMVCGTTQQIQLARQIENQGIQARIRTVYQIEYRTHYHETLPSLESDSDTKDIKKAR